MCSTMMATLDICGYPGCIPGNLLGWLGSMHAPQEENVFKTTELQSSVISLAKHLHNMHKLCRRVTLCRCVCKSVVCSDAPKE